MARARLLHVLALLAHGATPLTIIESTLHKLHRPPPGQRHVEVPDRLETAKAAIESASVAAHWLEAKNSTTTTVFDAVDALKRVHAVEHLREVQAMSKTGGGFDTDTCRGGVPV